MYRKHSLPSAFLLAILLLPICLSAGSAAPSEAAMIEDDGGTTFPTSGECGRFQDVYNSSAIDQETRDGIQFLACRYVIGGYPCNSVSQASRETCVPPDNLPYFRPYSSVTKGQLAKIVTNSHGFNTNYTGPQTFQDVSPSNTFYKYVETAYHNDLLDEDRCNVPPAVPACWFEPDKIATRGQAAKAAVMAAGYYLLDPSTPTFTDVPTTHEYYREIETAVARNLIDGYSGSYGNNPCTGLTEYPFLRYFRPCNNLTRSQFAKMDTRARFYHKGIAGYPNLIPYRGSPNYEYGAAFNPPRTDLRIIPSGEMNARPTAAQNQFRSHSKNIRWTPEAKSWLSSFPDGMTPGWEVTGRYSPIGVNTCPGGTFNTAVTHDLPGGYIHSSPNYPCTYRIIMSQPASIDTNTSYNVTMDWIASGGTGTTGRIQSASIMVTCDSNGCGQDIQRADLVGHLCYEIGKGIVDCYTDY